MAAKLFSPEDIFKVLKEKSPQSTMTFDRLIDINNKQRNIDLSDIKVPTFSICCGCLCKSYGYSCNCTGEGCYVGLEAEIYLEDGKAHAKLQARRIDPADEKPAPLPASAGRSQIHDITAEKHDFKELLVTKLTPDYRDSACTLNEKMALWCRDQTIEADIIDPLDDHFLDTKTEVETLSNNLAQNLSAQIENMPSIDGSTPERMAQGAMLSMVRMM